MKLGHLLAVSAAAVLTSGGAVTAQGQNAPTASPHTADSSTVTYGASTYRGADYGGAASGENAPGARIYGEWVRCCNPDNCPPDCLATYISDPDKNGLHTGLARRARSPLGGAHV